MSAMVASPGDVMGFDTLLDSRRSLRNKLLLDGREKLGYGESSTASTGFLLG